MTDAFMLKHVRRNKQGFVSIKLITSFRKVKAMSKDFQTVAYCLRHSDKLEVNEEGQLLINFVYNIYCLFDGLSICAYLALLIA